MDKHICLAVGICTYMETNCSHTSPFAYPDASACVYMCTNLYTYPHSTSIQIIEEIYINRNEISNIPFRIIYLKSLIKAYSFSLTLMPRFIMLLEVMAPLYPILALLDSFRIIGMLKWSYCRVSWEWISVFLLNIEMMIFKVLWL